MCHCCRDCGPCLVQHQSFFMEAPDVATPLVVPISEVSPILLHEQPDVGDNDTGKKTKRINYQNWEVAALIFGCHAACVAKPNSTVTFRSHFRPNSGG